MQPRRRFPGPCSLASASASLTRGGGIRAARRQPAPSNGAASRSPLPATHGKGPGLPSPYRSRTGRRPSPPNLVGGRVAVVTVTAGARSSRAVDAA